MDLRDSDRDARPAMCELLVDCFTAAEFRRFFADVSPGLVADLPELGCSTTKLVADGVDLLRRHGRVDQRFYEKWAERRPARRAEISAVAARMGCLLSQTTMAGASFLASAVGSTPAWWGPQGQDLSFWLLLAFVLLVIFAAFALVALRDSDFRVEYTAAIVLILAAVLFAFLRMPLPAIVALVAGFALLVWVGIRTDRRTAIARTYS